MVKTVVKTLFITGFFLSFIGIIRIGYFQVKAELAQHLMQSAWEESRQITDMATKRIEHENIKPWSWADTWPVLKMTIPSIDSAVLVLKDASGESLAFGPGLLTTSILPGDQGNSFIAAHRDTHFKQLGELKKDAIIFIEDRSKNTIRFKIDQIKIVDSRIEQPLVNTGDIRLTLVTCYPFDAKIANTPYRYLVSGTKVDEIEPMVRIRQSVETKLASLH